MTNQELSKLANEAWLGRLRIFKPRKGEKIGIPYKPWHHLAIIDQIVIVYIWDTREIIDAFPLSELASEFDTVKIVDSGKQLFIGKNTSSRAKTKVDIQLAAYPDLPIEKSNDIMDIKTVKAAAESALSEVDMSIFEMHDDASIVFVDADVELPDNLYMYRKAETFNPNKIKLADNNAYSGRAKYFAIQARCMILIEWQKHIQASKV